MIPGMQTGFVSGTLRGFDDVSQGLADVSPRPESAGQQDIPAIETGGIGAQHFDQKRRLEQPPQMTPHIVRAHAEKKRGPDLTLGEDLQQARYPKSGTAKGVDVDT